MARAKLGGTRPQTADQVVLSGVKLLRARQGDGDRGSQPSVGGRSSVMSGVAGAGLARGRGARVITRAEAHRSWAVR